MPFAENMHWILELILVSEELNLDFLIFMSDYFILWLIPLLDILSQTCMLNMANAFVMFYVTLIHFWELEL